ncbi:DIS3-like exonuclease 2 [Ceratina calcarata]|uniref:DIS3-like exonuclease 2 n=1 Tax=Ceratina calcarata TaxID=156304 RepID=A0AAJ7J5M5_9HYME|nr:DIS3-like exonuclease 2 [Ceratina calcarata]
MSKESTSSDFGTQNHSASVNNKKVARKVKKNKCETVATAVQCYYEKGTAVDKPRSLKNCSIKFGVDKKCCRQKEKNNAPINNIKDIVERGKDVANLTNDVQALIIDEFVNERVRRKRKGNNKKSKLKKGSSSREASVGEEDEEEEEVIVAAAVKEREVEESVQRKIRETFPKLIPVREIDEFIRNENSIDAQYVEGYLRVNPWNHKFAYISLGDDEFDLLIVGLRDRNRSFDGDHVVARVNPTDKWKTCQGQVQKTGVVVCIKEKVHPRKTVGHIKQRGGTSTFLYPRDHRVPLVRITKQSLEQFAIRPSNCENMLYLVVITDWTNPQFAVGKIEQIVGSIGDIKAESDAILLEHDLDVKPYDPKVIRGLPNSDHSLTEDDLTDREDWRSECVFTIDPKTAVDLDDAISCRILENKNYEIGVHISDVTHYLEFLSPLDVQISKRATTVYTTDNVYHMLPKQLCQVCSLTPGQDKLAFSVIWEITPGAEIVKHRFAKTVIKSCCQMAYEDAQKFIENPEDNSLDHPLIISGGDFTVEHLSTRVNRLHNLAVQMRSKRFENGALHINQPKLCISVDRITGLPVSYSIEEQRDSNRLIEEFMLLANTTVATHLYNTIPSSALLRNHKEPSKHMLGITKDTLQRFGIHLDIDSSASLHASLKRYEQIELEAENDETMKTMKYRMMVINSLCSKAMARATYRCSSTVRTEAELRHYALNVSLYTHFTSPIRRYSDCVVHRLLHSTIRDIDTLPDTWSEKLCKSIAANCNTKKYGAKMAQEKSSELYFTYFIDLNGPIVTMGIVLQVTESFVNVILCEVGIKLRIHFAQLKEFATIVEYSTECSVPTIRIVWRQPAVTQMINVFTLLYLRVEKHPETFQLIGSLLPPNYETVERR